MDWPSVTVIIPAFNARSTIRACIESVLAAPYQGQREIIVVDDRSTDDTCQVVRQLDCRLIELTQNGGPAVARNAGAAEAEGSVLLFVDSDTQMQPDTIVEAMRALDREGVGAVTGMYDVEPLNKGFFPAYYAYLKYHAFMSSSASTINAFGAQCGAVHKKLFDRVGGFRRIPWGMDIENDELGSRLNERSTVALERRFRVGHHFPQLTKLMMVFTSRVYWWILFRHHCGRDETVLMTRWFGLATAVLPAGLVSLAIATLVVDPLAEALLLTGCIAGAIAFASGYMDFWRLCRRRRGFAFAMGAMGSSALFSLLITTSAAWAYLRIAWLTLTGQAMPFTAREVQPA